MTINWFSPVPPTRSSIAFDTAAVLPALARRAKIIVWTHQPTWLPALEQHAQVRRYDLSAMPWGEINSADATFYHLGNHTDYHGPIWQVSAQHPGIVVLHDLNLQHFFVGLAARSVIRRRDYLQMMEVHHPEGGREIGQALLAGTKGVDEIYEEYPLTWAALENALGVAVHTRDGMGPLAEATDLPVAYVPLFAPPDGPSFTMEKELRTREADRVDGLYRIIMFGFLGLNRRLGSLLKALHQFPERHRFHLDVYGTVEEEQSFLQMVTTLKLDGLVTFHGFVSDADLNEALERSDLAINLRDPTMGEASASQLRIWQHGLPSLVTDTGWYATLPKNTVAVVRRGAEVEDIQTQLGEFLMAPERYRELGRNGRRYVNEHHTVEAYVDGLMQLISATIEAGPRESARWVSGRAGHSMRPWYSEKATVVLLPRLAEAIHDLFGEPQTGR